MSKRHAPMVIARGAFARLVGSVFRGPIDGGAGGADIFTNALDRVARSSSCGEHESESCKSGLHNTYLHVPSAELADRGPQRRFGGDVP